MLLLSTTQGHMEKGAVYGPGRGHSPWTSNLQNGKEGSGVLSPICGVLLRRPELRHGMKCHSSLLPHHPTQPAPLCCHGCVPVCLPHPTMSPLREGGPPCRVGPSQPITMYPAQGKSKDLQQGGLLGEPQLYLRSARAGGRHSQEASSAPAAARHTHFCPAG